MLIPWRVSQDMLHFVGCKQTKTPRLQWRIKDQWVETKNSFCFSMQFLFGADGTCFRHQNVYIFAERPLNTEPIEVRMAWGPGQEESNPWVNGVSWFLLIGGIGDI